MKAEDRQEEISRVMRLIQDAVDVEDGLHVSVSPTQLIVRLTPESRAVEVRFHIPPRIRLTVTSQEDQTA